MTPRSTSSVICKAPSFPANGTAIHAAVKASGKTNPNLFENNTTAVLAENGVLPDVRYNWWNSPPGPTTPQNPGGTGDLISGTALFQPFLTARPDTTDHPPVVRFAPPPYPIGTAHGVLDPGRKVILKWQSSDDHAIVKQKILFSPANNSKSDFTLIADNLPATQQAFEMIVPDVGFSVSGSFAFFRVVAIDDKGQEGWDEWAVLIGSGEEPGELQITSNVAGQTFVGNQEVPLTWTVTTPFHATTFDLYLVIDADRDLITLGGGANGQAYSPPKMPYISTDSARFVVASNNGLNRQKWFFSAPFAIRPDPRWVDAPPQINLTSPAAGQEFPAGSVVPVSWTASDDEALRGFSIQVSTDGGRNWIQVAENLPPTATSYSWQTPPGGALDDVRLRVVAVDRRYQNSSSGATSVFRLTSPANAAPGVSLTFPANSATMPRRPQHLPHRRCLGQRRHDSTR